MKVNIPVEVFKELQIQCLLNRLQPSHKSEKKKILRFISRNLAWRWFTLFVQSVNIHLRSSAKVILMQRRVCFRAWYTNLVSDGFLLERGNCITMFVSEAKTASMSECLRHSVPRRSKGGESVTATAVTDCWQRRPSMADILRRGGVTEQVRRRSRRRNGVWIWTHPVSWPVAGPGGQECAVVCGWDPPLSAPACPPSPHTSGLFIPRCGKITSPPVQSGSCKVYALHPHAHMQNTTLAPNSLNTNSSLLNCST